MSSPRQAMFITSFFCEFRQLFRIHVPIHWLMPFITYVESVVTLTLQGFFSASRAQITHINSILLFVVAGSHPESSLIFFPDFRTARLGVNYPRLPDWAFFDHH